MGYKMVVLDLDGTVVNSRGEITARTRQAVRAAVQAGMLVMVATGRRLRNALPAVRALGLEGPAVFCNGALAVDVTTWRTLLHEPMGARGLLAARQWQAAGLAPMACVHTLQGPDIYAAGPVVNAPDWLVRDQMEGHVAPAPFLLPVAADALKLMAMGPREAVAGLPDVAVMVTENGHGPALLELWRPDVNKATAVAALAEQAGIDRREIVAIGDQVNDVELLAFAGLGVAMGNAAPEARSAARTICPTCDEDGVAEVLEALVRPNRAAG